MSTFGERLRGLREEKGLSQDRAAEIFGVKRSTLAMWELGTRKPRKDKIDEIRDYYNVSYEYLMGDSDYKTSLESALAIVKEHYSDPSFKSTYNEALKKLFSKYSSVDQNNAYYFIIIKFYELTPEHQRIVSDMIDMYYEKDK